MKLEIVLSLGFLNIDETSGEVKGLSDNFYALLAVVETIIATKINWMDFSLSSKYGTSNISNKIINSSTTIIANRWFIF